MTFLGRSTAVLLRRTDSRCGQYTLRMAVAVVLGARISHLVDARMTGRADSRIWGFHSRRTVQAIQTENTIYRSFEMINLQPVTALVK